jgi:hypothetical protein
VASESVGYPPWKGVHVGPPFLGSALVCESVLEDVPGLTSVGGIHSSELVAVARGQTRTTLAREGEELFLWLRIYADGAPGEYELDVRFLSPAGDGLARQVARSTLTLDGVSAVIPIKLLTTNESGVHHFEVGIDGMLLARVPFEVQIVGAVGA